MRLAKRLPPFERSNAFKASTGRKVISYYDAEFYEELKTLMSDVKIRRKFYMIAEMLVSNTQISKSLYGHEMNSVKSRDVYAMKLKINGNHRIYCKEINSPLEKKIVLIAYRNKTTEGLDKKLRSLVDRIGVYDYEFQE